MSDNELDAELLALAGDDSASETETTKPVPVASKSPTPEESSTVTASKPRMPRALKGVAQRKITKPTRTAAGKRKTKDESEEEGQASSPDSLGSGAMSESESDTSPDATGDVDDVVRYAIDGKYVSEKEKAEFMAMPELVRESKLAERAQEIERKKQDQTLRQLRESRQHLAAQTAEVLKKRKAAVVELEESPRKVSKAKVKANDNLEAYKRQREQRADQRRRNEDSRKGDKLSPSQDNNLSDADADGESDVEWDNPAPKKAPPVKAEPQAELRDFERVRVGRSNFARVCFTPGFDDHIKGCFARVNIGVDKATGQTIYRMTQIKGITTGKYYNMEGLNGRLFHTNQWVILAQGKAEREWAFITCSDSKFTEAEFVRYKKAAAEENIRVPTHSFLLSKCDAISSLINHQWTSAEIDAKLRRSGVGDNFATEQVRQQLTGDREAAILQGNEAVIARLDQELAALDRPKPTAVSNSTNGTKAPVSKGPTQQERLAALNRANRKANQEEIRKAQLADKKKEALLQQAVLRGEATANPFARVKTRAKVVHDATPSNKAIDDLFGENSEPSRAGTPVPAAVKKTGAALGHKQGVASLAKQQKLASEYMANMDLGIELDI